MTRDDERGFTLIELLVVVSVMTIIAALAIPRLMRARMTGNETSAITSLKVTTSAQVAFSSGCGRGGYAADYTILGSAPAPTAEPYISPDLGSSVTPQKSGYDFTLDAGGNAAGPQDCLGNATNVGFLATATPITFGTTGTRSFAVNAGATVWQSTTAVPPTQPFTATATESPIQ